MPTCPVCEVVRKLRGLFTPYKRRCGLGREIRRKNIIYGEVDCEDSAGYLL